MSIKPIETVYHGYRFRSRLEARWAVFFVMANIEFEYEPEGFVLPNGTKYLPDFYLPFFDAYVEIKPKSITQKQREEAKNKLWDLVMCDGSYKTALYCEGDPLECNMKIATSAYDAEKAIPETYPAWYEARFMENVFVAYPMVPTNINDWHGPYELTPYRKCIAVGPVWDEFADTEWKFGFSNGENLVQYSNVINRHNCFEHAKLMARQARFEHGETPNVRSVAL
jgi:hypothetical protein